MFHSSLKLAAIIIAGLFIFSTFAGPASAVPGGKPTRVTACQDGGYRSFTDAAGNSFGSVGECVNYVASGGTLITSGPRIEEDFFVYFITEHAEWCESVYVVRGFPANTPVHIVYESVTTSGVHNVWEHDKVTDATGFSYAGGRSIPFGMLFVTATYTGTGGPVTISNAFACEARY